MPAGKTSSKAGPVRKRSLKSTDKSPDDANDQQTISGLFANSKQALKHGFEDQLDSSPSKRLKRDHSAAATSDAQSNQTIGRDKMYSFPPSKMKSASPIIDLTSTSSPINSPVKKKVKGLSRPVNPTANSAPQKLNVKNLRTGSRTDTEEELRYAQSQLGEALTAIFAAKPLPYAMEQLYKGVEQHCRQGKGLAVFDLLERRSTQIMQERLGEVKRLTRGMNNNLEIVKAVNGLWNQWNEQFHLVRTVFFYLDRSLLMHGTVRPSLEEMSKTLFREHVCLDPMLQHPAFEGVCELVASDRQAPLDEQQRKLASQSIQMFHVLGLYAQHFEVRISKASQDYYLHWTEQTVASNDLKGYIVMCDRLVSEEDERFRRLGIDATTNADMRKYIQEITIDQRHDRLLVEADVGQLLAQNDVATLNRLYLLLENSEEGGKLRQPFEAFINHTGSSIVDDDKREQDMVVRLLDLKQKVDDIVEKAFRGDKGIAHGVREAFETFINKSRRTSATWGTDNPKPGEMIAKYVDTILKGGSKAIRASFGAAAVSTKPVDEQGESSGDEDAEITKSLDQVLDLFRFVHGKAVFEAFYKRDLARRLLLSRSASADAEKSMLTRLKAECGAGFTHNLEQMFKDIEMARDEITSYKSRLEGQGKRTPFDLSVNVLSASAWPSYPDLKVNVPEKILNASLEFEKYYKEKHTGRSLQWKHALAHCQLKSKFPKGNKEIVVSSFQAIVLLAFNESDKHSYANLQASTGLDDSELQRTLQSLACARYRVLRKHPPSKEVSRTDTFTTNPDFTHPKYRIKINQIQAKETKAENKSTHERVAADRQFETQAAIVRIMKGRKRITHAELIAEVLKATRARGALEPADIKREVGKLIEKDYMEREEDEDGEGGGREAGGSTVYLYVS